MRVQRAPLAADQPHRPSSGIPVPAGSTVSAQVDLDLTDLLARLDEAGATAEVVHRLVTACHLEGLIDDEASLRIVKLSAVDKMGGQLPAAVTQSAYSICSCLTSLSPAVPAVTASTLTVLLSGTRVHVVGEAGPGGLGVVTLGPVTPTLVPSYGDGLSIMQRRVARLGLTVRSSASGAAVVRVLESVARSVEGSSVPLGS
ncbi:MAG: hypothetical protein ABR549_03490 [Mycobacteriales bacterium]